MYHEFKALEIYISIFIRICGEIVLSARNTLKSFELSNLSQIWYNSYHNDLLPTGPGLIKL